MTLHRRQTKINHTQRKQIEYDDHIPNKTVVEGHSERGWREEIGELEPPHPVTDSRRQNIRDSDRV